MKLQARGIFVCLVQDAFFIVKSKETCSRFIRIDGSFTQSISQLLLVLLLLCYVNLSKNSFLIASQVVNSRKRVQRYALFPYPPNISAKKFNYLTLV